MRNCKKKTHTHKVVLYGHVSYFIIYLRKCDYTVAKRQVIYISLFQATAQVHAAIETHCNRLMPFVAQVVLSFLFHFRQQMNFACGHTAVDCAKLTVIAVITSGHASYNFYFILKMVSVCVKCEIRQQEPLFSVCCLKRNYTNRTT